MKICFYNVTATYLGGGLETYCWEAGRAMARRGHHVDVVAGNRGMARHSEASLVQFSFRPEMEWPDLGVRFRRLAERASFASASLPHLLKARYDAVVVNKPFDFPILWYARRRGLRAKTVFRSGGTDFFPGDRLFASAVDFWASASRFNAGQIEARYGRRTSVIHNGVDVDIFRPMAPEDRRSRAWAGDDEVLLVSVGRLVGWKGIGIAIDALASLPPRAKLLIVGDGPEAPRLEARAEALGLAGRTMFAGRVEHSALPALLARCDILVQPSVGDEAFGISVVEAMSCGLPVVASRSGGMPEIVVPGVTGQLVDRGDPVALARALLPLVVDAESRKVMGAAARRRALEEFTWARNAEALEKLIVDAS